MQLLWENQRPDLLTCLMEMSLVLCLPRELHLCRSSSNVHRTLSQKGGPRPSPFWLRNVLRATASCIFSTSQVLQSGPNVSCFSILTSPCASCHSRVHFLNSPILTSKSASCHHGVPHGCAPAALVSLRIFRPGKQCFAALLPFRAIFFLLTLSLLFRSFLTLLLSHHCYCICP